ncbi:hypothetical protein [Psychroserpens sp. MEBiC05023]
MSKTVMFQALALEKLIRSWNLISGSSKGEFDALSHKLISHLYRKSDFKTLTRVIQSELISYYGFDIEDDEAINFATEVSKWWELQP